MLSLSIIPLYIYQCSLHLSMLSLSIYALFVYVFSIYLSVLSLTFYPLFIYLSSLWISILSIYAISMAHSFFCILLYTIIFATLSFTNLFSLFQPLSPYQMCKVKTIWLKGKASPITLFVTDGRFDEANNTNCNLQFQTKNTKNLSNLGCRTSSVDSSVPSILSPLVRVSSTPSTLLSIYIWIVSCGKDENKRKRGRDWPIF